MGKSSSNYRIRVGIRVDWSASGGLSGFVMIAESHLSFHTFPARGFVTIDLYTCQTDLDRESCCNRLMVAFGITDADMYIQERGMRYPAADLTAA